MQEALCPQRILAFPKKALSNILSPVIYCDLSKINNHTNQTEAWMDEEA